MLNDFDVILDLINTHGEPSECQIKDCSSCDIIRQFRKDHYGTERRKRGRSSAYVYTATDKKGNTYTFTKQVELRKFLNCGETTMKPFYNTDDRFNGYLLKKELL